MSENLNVKEHARQLIDELPEDATWDDLMYKIYVRLSIEPGLEDSKAGRTTSINDVRAKYGLPK